MFKKLLILLFFPLILASCSDEPSEDMFTIYVAEAPQGNEITVNGTECEISTKGEKQTINIALVGDFDSFNISDGVAEWINVSAGEASFRLNLSEFYGNDDDIRNAVVGFTVFKGKETVAGRIIVLQHALTRQDLHDREQKAVSCWLSDKTVIDFLPSDISLVRCGENAPYYNLADGKVYMQVKSMGSAPAAVRGERVYFRFMRYNLLSFMENGILPDGNGNGIDLTQPSTFFELGSDQPASDQWGPAIQMPLLSGLPPDSEINLVVMSEAGFKSETSQFIPFLYNIRYFRSAM